MPAAMTPAVPPDAYVSPERANQEMAAYDDLMRPKVPPELQPVSVECRCEPEGWEFTAELQHKRLFLRYSCPMCRVEYPEGTAVCPKDNMRLGRTAPIKGSERVFALQWHWERGPFPPEFAAEWQRKRADGNETVEFKKWKSSVWQDLVKRFAGHRLPDSVRVTLPAAKKSA